MAGEWISRRIGDLGKVITGKTPSTKVADNFGGPYPFITIPDMDGRREIDTSARSLSEKGASVLRTCMLPPRAVMMSCIATIGRCGITTRPSFTNQQINSLICGPEADPTYVYYAFSQLGQALEAAGGGGSVYTNVSKSRFEDIEIKLPPLPEQKAIARILGTLDDKIELNRRMNATLEAMARALFQSWFVDFDPVHAKAADRQPAGMDAQTAALFPYSFQASELGEIPAGWKVQNLEEVAERVAMGPFGSSIKVSTFVEEGIPVISGQHLHGIMLEDSTFNFVTEPHATQLHRANVQRGDVIFTHAGSIGQVAYIAETSQYSRYVISQRQFFMRCAPAKMSPLYVVLYFKTPEGQHRLLANTSSTGVPSIARPVTYLRQLKLVIPPPEVLARFDELAGGWMRQISANLNQSRTLANLRNTLLPKLLSGELSPTP